MTLNTYTRVMPNALPEAVSRVSEELFRIVHSPVGRSELISSKDYLFRLDLNQQPSGCRPASSEWPRGLTDPNVNCIINDVFNNGKSIG